MDMAALSKVMLIAVMLVFQAPKLYAESHGSGHVRADPVSEKQSHIDSGSPAKNAGEGVKDLLFGWTDIPKSIAETTRDSGNPLWGLTGGTLKGVGKAFPRTVSGITEVLTSPASQGDDKSVRPDKLNARLR